MMLYLNMALLRELGRADSDVAARLVLVTTEVPPLPETPPSYWLACKPGPDIRILDLDTATGREAFAKILTEVPLYRIKLELLVDGILDDARQDPVRMKAVRAAFAPEDAPEPVIDSMSQKYALAGTLKFPGLASRTEEQLLDIYLKLLPAVDPQYHDPAAHIAIITEGYTERLLERAEGIVWRGYGWVRLDCIIYEGERTDHDPEVTFESYVARGRAGAEALSITEPESLLAAWILAERVQRTLCRDIDFILRLPDIRRLPRWVRADVFRILEREAMKQVFAEHLVKLYADWPALRRATILSEPITANSKGEVAPLIQQLLNQTLSADARYAGSAEAFALQAERRFSEAEKLLKS